MTILAPRPAVLRLVAEQHRQCVQQGTELIPAGQPGNTAVRGPQAGLGAGRGDDDLGVRTLELLPAQYRLIEATADQTQPGRSRHPGDHATPLYALHALIVVPGPLTADKRLRLAR